MGQVLHGSARTTEAARCTIQYSEERLRALAKRHGINQKTLAKWKKAYGGQGLADRVQTFHIKPSPANTGTEQIHLRGELASMLSLFAGAEKQKASAGMTEEVLQMKMVAGTGFEPVTFRL